MIFHLQTCDKPVLPPLHELFEDSCAAVASRPIHEGKSIDWDKLEVIVCILAQSLLQMLAVHC